MRGPGPTLTTGTLTLIHGFLGPKTFEAITRVFGSVAIPSHASDIHLYLSNLTASTTKHINQQG